MRLQIRNLCCVGILTVCLIAFAAMDSATASEERIGAHVEPDLSQPASDRNLLLPLSLDFSLQQRGEASPYRPALSDSTVLDSILVVAMDDYHIPGLTACIVKDGEIVWRRAHGYADVLQGVEATDSTVFMLASISKTFVGVAMMQLWEDGLLGLDDDINDCLPFDVANPYHSDVAITPRCCAHASTIRYNADAWLPLFIYGDDSPIPLGDFLADYLVPGGVYYDPRNFRSYAPGTWGEYSNIAYALAGYLVERISGQSLEQYCQKSVFEPLGMHETSWFLAGLDEENVAVPTDWSAGHYHQYGHFGFPVYPAGQLRSSSLQLARHLIAFMQGGQIDGTRLLLEESTVDLMTTIQFPETTVFPGYAWGLGWYRIDTGAGYLWGHTGGVFGVSTMMYYDPDDAYGFLYLTNASGNDGHGIIANAIYEYAAGLGDETSVYLTYFTAERVGADALLNWDVGHRMAGDGFHVWRLASEGKPARITNRPLTDESGYEFLDTNAPAQATEYWLQRIGTDGEEIWLGRVTLQSCGGFPDMMSVAQNYPNPFNPSTTISFRLPSSSRVKVSVYDLFGQRVTSLLNGYRPAGVHRCVWDGKDSKGSEVAGGIYVYQVQADDFNVSRKMTLMK